MKSGWFGRQATSFLFRSIEESFSGEKQLITSPLTRFLLIGAIIDDDKKIRITDPAR